MNATGNGTVLPQVSVIVPFYNEGKLVNRALASLAVQTYRGPIEIVVVDDAAKEPPPIEVDPRHPLKVVRAERNGYAGASRNLGVKHSHGEFLCFLDADDEFLPERIEKHIDFFLEQPHLAMVGAAYHLHRGTVGLQIPEPIEKYYPQLQHQRCILPEDFRYTICHEYCFHTSSFTLPRRVFDQVGGYIESQRWGEEWDLQVRAAQIGLTGYLPEPLSRYLCRDTGSITTTKNPEKYETAAQIFSSWRRTIPGLPAALKKALRWRERQQLLLAAQLYLENRHNAPRALKCAWASVTCSPSIWGIRSVIRTALHTCFPMLTARLGEGTAP